MAFMERPHGCPPDVDAVDSYWGCRPEEKLFPFTADEAL